jgi:hypothetical protein
MKTLKWTQRICIGSSIAVASLFAVPAIAGADTTCYTGCTPTAAANNSTVPPPTDAANTTASVSGSSSLPFTGADVGELAAVGAGAIVVGGLLARRRRSAS